MSKSPPIPSQTCLVRWRAESSLALALDISGGVEKKNIPGRREHRRHHAWEVSLPAGKYYYSWVFFSGQGEKAQSRTPFPFSVGEADRRIEIDGGKIRREGREGRFLAAESQRTWPVPGQIGHRGDGAKASSSPQGRGKAKENTLASVRAAWEKGATAVEVDVQLHQGVIWVEHDDLGNPDPEGPPHAPAPSLRAAAPSPAGLGLRPGDQILPPGPRRGQAFAARFLPVRLFQGYPAGLPGHSGNLAGLAPEKSLSF